MKSLKPIILPKIYFPGLISIVLLPLCCIIYIYYYQVQYGMKISWFDSKGIERLNRLYGQKIDYTTFRRYSNLYLTGYKEHDKSELKRLKKFADALVLTDDQKNGVCINLTYKTKYQDIITALDICMNHESLGVIPLNDNIYLFKFDTPVSYPPIKKPPVIDLGNDVVVIAPSHKIFNDLQVFFSIASFWPCLIPLVGMFYFWSKTKRMKRAASNMPVIGA